MPRPTHASCLHPPTRAVQPGQSPGGPRLLVARVHAPVLRLVGCQQAQLGAGPARPAVSLHALGQRPRRTPTQHHHGAPAPHRHVGDHVRKPAPAAACGQAPVAREEQVAGGARHKRLHGRARGGAVVQHHAHRQPRCGRVVRRDLHREAQRQAAVQHGRRLLPREPARGQLAHQVDHLHHLHPLRAGGQAARLARLLLGREQRGHAAQHALRGRGVGRGRRGEAQGGVDAADALRRALVRGQGLARVEAPWLLHQPARPPAQCAAQGWVAQQVGCMDREVQAGQRQATCLLFRTECGTVSMPGPGRCRVQLLAARTDVFLQLEQLWVDMAMPDSFA
mmetsp:Transcript_30844/g.78762  ORF Transcript_30844/g.78762 Transcript_30844/m.78762 type:complete len:337 (+) Transcript_30844:71-1081(+)